MLDHKNFILFIGIWITAVLILSCNVSQIDHYVLLNVRTYVVDWLMLVGMIEQHVIPDEAHTATVSIHWKLLVPNLLWGALLIQAGIALWVNNK